MARNQTAFAIELGGKERRLVLDFEALSRIEELTEQSVFDDRFWSDISARKLRAVLWAAMLDGEPDIEITAVGKMIDTSNMREVIDVLVTMWQAAMPDREEGASNEADPTTTAPASTGMT